MYMKLNYIFCLSGGFVDVCYCICKVFMIFNGYILVEELE